MNPVVAALAARVRSAPGSPLVTFVDQARGERTELSAASLANAAAKIGNALRDEYDLEPGARVALLLPLHWQLAAWLAGAWTAGMVVTTQPHDPADLVVTTLEGMADVDTEVALVSLHPFGLPITDPLPAHAHDVTLAVRQQPDAYLFDTPSGFAPAMIVDDQEVSSTQVWDRASSLAVAWDLQPGGRLLLPGSVVDDEALLGVLAVPLAASAAVVVAPAAQDLSSLETSERVSAIAARRP